MKWKFKHVKGLSSPRNIFPPQKACKQSHNHVISMRQVGCCISINVKCIETLGCIQIVANYVVYIVSFYAISSRYIQYVYCPNQLVV